jgi:hypothetical protein
MKCKTCGKNSDGEYCFIHKARKPLSSSGKGLTSRKVSIGGNYKAMEVLVKEISNLKTQMREMFLTIWKKKPHRSEVSNTYLGSEPMSTYFHHILPKEKYPEACLDEENIILLTLEEHSNVENDMYKYEEVNDRRNHLKLKYERT